MFSPSILAKTTLLVAGFLALSAPFQVPDYAYIARTYKQGKEKSYWQLHFVRNGRDRVVCQVTNDSYGLKWTDRQNVAYIENEKRLISVDILNAEKRTLRESTSIKLASQYLPTPCYTFGEAKNPKGYCTFENGHYKVSTKAPTSPSSTAFEGYRPAKFDWEGKSYEVNQSDSDSSFSCDGISIRTENPLMEWRILSHHEAGSTFVIGGEPYLHDSKEWLSRFDWAKGKEYVLVKNKSGVLPYWDRGLWTAGEVGRRVEKLEDGRQVLAYRAVIGSLSGPEQIAIGGRLTAVRGLDLRPLK